MKKDFYEKLKHDFTVVRTVFSCVDAYDEFQLCSAVEHLHLAKRTVDERADAEQRRVLGYCIDTMLQIISEGDSQKTADFADAVHNVPEIYMGHRNLYSFRGEFISFRKKYGRSYFRPLTAVYPRFSKHAPKNSPEFFSAQSDVDFKLMHPVGYNILVACGIAALFLPIVVYMLCVFSMPDVNQDDPVLVMGFLGGFIMGVALFNIVAAWIHQYLGHKLTAVCALLGTALMCLSVALL